MRRPKHNMICLYMVWNLGRRHVLTFMVEGRRNMYQPKGTKIQRGSRKQQANWRKNCQEVHSTTFIRFQGITSLPRNSTILAYSFHSPIVALLIQRTFSNAPSKLLVMDSFGFIGTALYKYHSSIYPMCINFWICDINNFSSDSN